MILTDQFRTISCLKYDITNLILFMIYNTYKFIFYLDWQIEFAIRLVPRALNWFYFVKQFRLT